MAKRRKRGYADEDEVAQLPPVPDERIVLRHLDGGTNTLEASTVKTLCHGVVDPKKQKYLMYLSVLGNRTRAAQATGVCQATVFLWRREDDNFRRQFMVALDIASELHEDELFRRASEGVLEPVFQGGQMIGSIRKFDTTALIFALKGAMPDKYADRQKVDHSGEINVTERLRAAREKARKK